MVVSKIPFLFRPVRVGDIIVFRHRLYGTLIKAVAEVLPEGGGIRVTGTHPASVDSREFGPVQAREVLGKVILHIPRS